MNEKQKKETRLLDTLKSIRQQIDNFERSTTYRKFAELVLIESEERYRTLFEAANDAILLIQDNQIIDCNAKALEVFGCTKPELANGYPGKFLPEYQPDGQPSKITSQEKIKLALKGSRQFYEWKYCRYDGILFDAEVSLNRVELSGKSFLQAIVRDITKRKIAEEELKKERQKLQTLLEQAPFGMVLVDINDEYKYMNPRFRELFGYNLNDVPNGRTWFKKAYPEKSYRRTVIAAWKEDIRKKVKHRKVPRTFSVNSKDGKEKIVNFRVVQLEKDGGYLVTCEDITDLKRLEDELLNAQKLESIGTLAGGIAHDFNNILAVVLGNISLARSHINNEKLANARMLEAEKACLRAKDLTQQLLMFSGVGDSVKKTVDLKNILRDAVNNTITGSEVHCRFLFTDELFPIAADEREIRQVFNNILLNAREAMPFGGTLSISVENVTENPKDELPFLERDYVRILLEDTGIGIPKNQIRKIFDPYYTTKPLGAQKGLGLGLAICYSIIKKHNGLIDVVSNVDSGTKVNVYLPAIRNVSDP